MKNVLTYIRDPLKMQFKWEFILLKNYYSPLGDPVRGDPNKRGSKSENCAFFNNSNPPLNSILVWVHFTKKYWRPWGDPVRAVPTKQSQRGTKSKNCIFLHNSDFYIQS